MVMNTSPGETKLLASEIYEILQAAGNEEEARAEGEAASCKRKAHFFLGSSNKRAKTVVLHIDGLDDPVSVGRTPTRRSRRTSVDSQLAVLIFGHGARCCGHHCCQNGLKTRRSLCEEALLKIRGVISFTFQMAVKRCVVRIRSDLKADALGTAINSTKVMTAQQVVRTDDGEELMVPFQEDSTAVVEENTDIPDYLPEEESPSQEQDKAVTRIGSVTDGMGWLSTAANFLTRSFYWQLIIVSIAHYCPLDDLDVPDQGGGGCGEGAGVSLHPLTPPRPTTISGADWWDEILRVKIKRSWCQNNS
ncbi:unnamed protein product [Tetraodon nigroviridis]|uniref:(spotted green pufferfish) hypothetical protein n=1 Tax=Tetraodon nigroviridis TaxID=99883 RepID=Q4S585_TETNG|nr:unnamed protein product [Tetraodon nigroviridis]